MTASASLSRTYLVECYQPGIERAEVESVTDRALAASAELREEGRKVEYVGAILVPGERRRMTRNESSEIHQKEDSMSSNGRVRLLLLATATVLTVTGVNAVVGALARAAQADGVAPGTLGLRAAVPIRYPETPCPADTPGNFECFARTGNTIVSGLGALEESYAYVLENAPAGCTAPPGADSVRLPPTAARLTVPGKGEIEVSTSGTGCLNRFGTLTASEPFTITGGSGVYAGASGGGTVTTASYGPPSFNGNDTWTGTVVVAGMEFDLTAPSIHGALDKTVRAPRRAKGVRVVYTVTAQDDVDGTVPVTCRPAVVCGRRIGCA